MDWLFVHIPRTAGSWLRQQLGIGAAVIHDTHLPLWKHKETEAASAWSFATVRNPWDRLVSLWTMQHRGGPTDFQFWVEQLADTFDAVRDDRSHPYALGVLDCGLNLLLPQTTWLESKNGKELLVDHVMHFESLRWDTAFLSRRIKREIDVRRNPVGATGRSRDWRSYYDERTYRIVRELYASDVRVFGYG